MCLDSDVFPLLSILTMISIADQRDVPQYMDMPWLMTCVMALTISKTQNTHVQTKISAKIGLLLYRSTVPL